MMKLVLIAMSAGFTHGVNEGLDMHQPNPRKHRWFEYYHRLWILEAALLIWFGYAGRGIPFGWWICPALILANRMYEIAYGWTRYGKPWPDYEHFLGAGIYLRGWHVRLVQFGGLTGGLAWGILEGIR